MTSDAAAHDPQDEAVEVSAGEIESGGDAAGETAGAGGGVAAGSAADDHAAEDAGADVRGDGDGGSDGRSGRCRTSVIVVGALAAMAAMAAGAVLIYWAFDDDGAGREAGAGERWFADEPGRDGRDRGDDRHERFGGGGDSGIALDAAAGTRKGGGRYLDGEGIDRLAPEPGGAKGDGALTGEGVSKDCRTVARLPRHVLLACPRDGFDGGDFGPWAYRRGDPFAPGLDGGPGAWSGEGGKDFGFPDGKDGPRRFDRNDGWGWPGGWHGWGPKGSFGFDFGGGGGYRFDGAEPFGGEIGPREFFGGDWFPAPGSEWTEPSPRTCTFEWSDPSGESGRAFGGDCLDLFDGIEGPEGFGDGSGVPEGGFDPEALDGLIPPELLEEWFGRLFGSILGGPVGELDAEGLGGSMPPEPTEEMFEDMLGSILGDLFDGFDLEGFDPGGLGFGFDPEALGDLIPGELIEELFGELLGSLLAGVDLGDLNPEAPDVGPGDGPDAT